MFVFWFVFWFLCRKSGSDLSGGAAVLAAEASAGLVVWGKPGSRGLGRSCGLGKPCGPGSTSLGRSCSRRRARFFPCSHVSIIFCWFSGVFLFFVFVRFLCRKSCSDVSGGAAVPAAQGLCTCVPVSLCACVYLCLCVCVCVRTCMCGWWSGKGPFRAS